MIRALRAVGSAVSGEASTSATSRSTLSSLPVLAGGDDRLRPRAQPGDAAGRQVGRGGQRQPLRLGQLAAPDVRLGADEPQLPGQLARRAAGETQLGALDRGDQVVGGERLRRRALVPAAARAGSAPRRKCSASTIASAAPACSSQVARQPVAERPDPRR